LSLEHGERVRTWDGCIAGALESGEYLNIIHDSGFSDIQVINETPYTVGVSGDLIGKILSINVKAYKLEA
jgi:hypothetical protein